VKKKKKKKKGKKKKVKKKGQELQGADVHHCEGHGDVQSKGRAVRHGCCGCHLSCQR